MSPTLIAFTVGVFVGVLGGIFIIGILQMAKEERGDHHAQIYCGRSSESFACYGRDGSALDFPEEIAGGAAQSHADQRGGSVGISNSGREEGKNQ